MGWLELEWTWLRRSPRWNQIMGLTDTSNLEEALSSSLFGRSTRVSKQFCFVLFCFFPHMVQVPFKLLVFCRVPGWVSLHLGSFAISLPSAKHWAVSGIPTGTASPCLSYQFRCGPSICSSCLVSLHIFRRNCSKCRCRFGALVGGGQFRISLCQYLGTL